MESYNKLWRLFFAIALIGTAIQQIICADFRPLMLPLWPAWLPGRLIGMYIYSAALILASLAIAFEINARSVSIIIGLKFLALFLIFHLPYQTQTNLHFLGGWGDTFKILALAGGAFIVAASLPEEKNILSNLYKILPAGRYFFAVTMIVFGVEHFIYTPFVAMLVPAWVPFQTFWAYFAGVALIAAGIAIFLNIKTKLAANLLGIMIFIWLITLHIPRAIADPHTGNGNEWTSVFEALAFSGIAFLIAGNFDRKLPEVVYITA